MKNLVPNKRTSILFVGYTLDESECIKNTAAHLAANRAQLGLIGGLNELENVALECVTVLPSLYYPLTKKLFYGVRKTQLSNGVKLIILPFVNLVVLKHLTSSISLFIKILLWSIRYYNWNKVIISYNLDVPIPQTIMIFQNLGVRFLPFIFDLPVMSKQVSGGFRGWLINQNHKQQSEIMRRLKEVIILNENVAIDFKLDRYIVIEGGITTRDIFVDCNSDRHVRDISTVFKVFYSGSITKHQGVDNLIEAFQYLDKDKYSLTICGRGDLSIWVEERCIKAKNMKYLGILPTEQLCKLQEESDLLIIPQPCSSPNVRYQFPSKIFEYMISGTPVLSVNLPGLLIEYQQFIYMTDGFSPVELSQSIQKVCAIPRSEREIKGKSARKFILENKTWTRQCKKIITYINKK